MLEETGSAVMEPQADRAQAALDQFHPTGPRRHIVVHGSARLGKKLPHQGFSGPPAPSPFNRPLHSARVYNFFQTLRNID